MVAASHRADDGCPARNHQRLSQGRGHRGAGPWAAPRVTSETGHFHRLGVHRLWWRKSGISEAVSTDAGEAKAATRAEVSTDSVPLPRTFIVWTTLPDFSSQSDTSMVMSSEKASHRPSFDATRFSGRRFPVSMSSKDSPVSAFQRRIGDWPELT
jgi:hypothetical protein